ALPQRFILFVLRLLFPAAARLMDLIFKNGKTIKGGHPTMLVLCYPKCTTCQKAVNLLEEKGVSYTYRDIKEDNPTYEELKSWYGRSGLPLKRFFNTSGLQYKALGLKDKLPVMSEEEQLRLLAADG